jgi:hypothetical protein
MGSFGQTSLKQKISSKCTFKGPVLGYISCLFTSKLHTGSSPFFLSTLLCNWDGLETVPKLIRLLV